MYLALFITLKLHITIKYTIIRNNTVKHYIPMYKTRQIFTIILYNSVQHYKYIKEPEGQGPGARNQELGARRTGNRRPT